MIKKLLCASLLMALLIAVPTTHTMSLEQHPTVFRYISDKVTVYTCPQIGLTAKLSHDNQKHSAIEQLRGGTIEVLRSPSAYFAHLEQVWLSQQEKNSAHT